MNDTTTTSHQVPHPKSIIFSEWPEKHWSVGSVAASYYRGALLAGWSNTLARSVLSCALLRLPSVLFDAFHKLDSTAPNHAPISLHTLNIQTRTETFYNQLMLPQMEHDSSRVCLAFGGINGAHKHTHIHAYRPPSRCLPTPE